jgi:hypothetical protein
MRFEILISKELGTGTPNIYLDTFQEQSISLNFNIADITDISKKNSSYSKTISLPDTERNRRAFDDIFNLEAYDPTWSNGRGFNPNKKVACIVLGDTLEIFRGNLQLTNIVYDFNGYRNSYEVVIYSDNDTLFKIVGEQYLSDLDLTRYNHSYRRESMEKSWGLNGGSGNYTDGFFYPLIDYGFPLFYPEAPQTNYPIYFNKLYPGIYAKIIFDQIFSEAGFSYTSQFLNDYRFTELIIPFSNKTFKPVPSITTGDNNLIFAAIKSATTSVSFTPFPQAQSTVRGYSTLAVDSEFFDPNNFYDTSTYSYINTTNETFKQNFTINFKIRVTSNFSYTPWSSQIDEIRICCKRSTKSNGTPNPAWSNTPTLEELFASGNANYFRDITFNGARFIRVDNSVGASSINRIIKELPSVPGSVSNWSIEGTVTTDWIFDDPIQPNEEVKFFIYRQYDIFQFPTILEFDILPDTKVWSTLDPTETTYGANISITDILPSKVKQKDFLISIFKMFNLYIEPSKDIINNFIIEPRDEYYQLYQTDKDWSDKLDLSKEINSEILSNLQKRTNLFTYKSDKDIYNENYTTNTNEIFGQFKFEIDNDFISGDNKIETIFSPTPIDRLPGPGDFYLPIIANLNNGNYVKPDGMNIRILFKQLKTVSTNPFVVVDPVTEAQYSYSFYPYVGADNDPLYPTYTLNFGSISPFISGYKGTLRNLFNTYYRNQISELNDEGSRLITANFKLNSYDINQFKFSDLIYFTINGMSDWYRVNKIMDYDPLSEGTTKVQLIKAYNYTLQLNSIGLTPSTEFCEVKMETTLSYNALIDLMSTIGSYANSQFPILTFYNTYENVGYSYGPVSENIGITDIELWVQSSGPTGLSITYNSTEASETFAWKQNVPCDTGPYTFLIGMGDTMNSLNNIQPIFDTPFVDCSCQNLNRVSAYLENGLRNVISTDNIYVGVLNTSTSNKTSLPNVAMVGENNTISNIGIMTIGDGNSALGSNSLLVGKSNESTSQQSLIVGDTNTVNGKNSFAIGSNNLVSPPQSFVLGVGNQLQAIQQDTYTFSSPGTTSVFGTFSKTGTQSIIVVGSNNISLSTTGFVYGSNNLIGLSASNAIIFGENNNLGFNGSGPSGSSFENIVLFGNNITIDPTFSSTQSFNSSFIIGNNITLTQSISDTTYLYTENIILSENGGFNPPFIISDAVSTTPQPTGQSIIKTITGYYDQNLTAASLDFILDDYVNADILTDQTPIIVEANVRLENSFGAFPPTYECGVVSLFGVFTKNGASFELVGSVDKIEKNNFSVADKTADLTDTLGNINLYIESSGGDFCNFYWDITFRYRYE